MGKGTKSIGAIAFAMLLAACSGSDRTLVVSRDQYGDQWPWPDFETATISCVERDAVTVKLGDVLYGLNGRAQSSRGLPDARLMMARTPDTEDISADGLGLFELGATGELIKAGLAIC